MRPFILGFFLVLIGLVTFSSCDQALNKNRDLALKVIPANATSVTSFRIPQILEKSDFDEFQTLPIYKKLVEEAKAENLAIGKIVENPAQSGIDLDKSIYAFTQLSSKNPEDIINAVVIPIKDYSAFTAMIGEMDLEDVEEAGNFNSVRTGRKSGLIWNKELALVAMSNRSRNDWMELSEYLDGEGNSIATDDNLQKSMSQDHDIVTWASSNAIANYKDAQLMIAGLGFDPDALKDNFIQGYLNFENGEVVGHSDLLLQKTLTKDLDLLFRDEVKTDFSPYVPGENLGMAFSAALDFKGLNQVLAERPQSKGFLNYALKEYGLSIDDIAKALGGDLMLAVYNEGETENVSGLFSTNIDDEKIFDQFITLAIDYEILEKVEDGYYRLMNGKFPIDKMLPSGVPSIGNDQPYLLLAHDMVFISANTALLQDIKDGGFKKSQRLPKEFMNQVSSNIFSAMMDFSKLGEVKSNNGNLPMQNMEINASRKSSEFHLFLEDQNTNSLKSLLWQLNDSYEKEELGFSKDESSI